MKNLLKSVIDGVVAVLAWTKAGRYAFARATANAREATAAVAHNGVVLTFAAPNALARGRAETFATKEPETLDWIDGIPQSSILWDIGANVGLYTCYAARARDCRVYAFEPSPFNIELLARNVVLNSLASKVVIVPLPLSESLGAAKLNMSSTEWGGAMSTFGEGYGHDGKALAKVFEYPTVGLSMADAVNALQIPRPDYIKMDVDGIEHLILKGGGEILRGAQGVLIEINDEFAAQASGAKALLEQAGFKLKEKKQADVKLTGGAAGTFNQIWVRA